MKKKELLQKINELEKQIKYYEILHPEMKVLWFNWRRLYLEKMQTHCKEMEETILFGFFKK